MEYVLSSRGVFFAFWIAFCISQTSSNSSSSELIRRYILSSNKLETDSRKISQRKICIFSSSYFTTSNFSSSFESSSNSLIWQAKSLKIILLLSCSSSCKDNTFDSSNSNFGLSSKFLESDIETFSNSLGGLPSTTFLSNERQSAGRLGYEWSSRGRLFSYTGLFSFFDCSCE